MRLIPWIISVQGKSCEQYFAPQKFPPTEIESFWTVKMTIENKPAKRTTSLPFEGIGRWTSQYRKRWKVRPLLRFSFNKIKHYHEITRQKSENFGLPEKKRPATEQFRTVTCSRILWAVNFFSGLLFVSNRGNNMSNKTITFVSMFFFRWILPSFFPTKVGSTRRQAFRCFRKRGRKPKPFFFCFISRFFFSFLSVE